MKNGAVIFGLLFALVAGHVAEAKQYATKKNGKEVVVHDRLAPVVMHRVFPPYLGKHVYDRSAK